MKRRYLTAALLFASAAAAARADVQFTGVAAGDPTSSSVILWTRAVDPAAPAASALTLQYGTDEKFATFHSATVSTNAGRDYTVKHDLSGLQANTRYFYRFNHAASMQTSAVGTFKTAPEASSPAEIKFAFSGDTHTQWRPYPAANGIAAERLDFFIFLGDTIYESSARASGSLPGSATIQASDTLTPAATPEKLLADYRTKYREQFYPVNRDGRASLAPLYAAQANYTVLDNHELGSKQYIDGGAPPGDLVGGVAGTAAGVSTTGGATFDVNTTGKFMNQVPAYRSKLQAYLDYQPVRESFRSVRRSTRSACGAAMAPRPALTVGRPGSAAFAQNEMFC